MKAWFTRLRTGWLVDVSNGPGEYMTTAGPFTTLYGARRWARQGLRQASNKWSRRGTLMDVLNVQRRGCAWREVRAEIDREVPRMGLEGMGPEWPATLIKVRAPVFRRGGECQVWPCMKSSKATRGTGCGRPA